MSKIRIYTLAKELGMENGQLLAMLDDLGVSYKSVSSTLEEDTVETIRGLAQETAPQGGAGPVESEQRGAEPASTPEATPVSGASAEAAAGGEARAPVVAIMGHVDHGKTSLLDHIRKTRVAAKEAGGITQHVGAFEAQTSRGKVVFIDTPGHEAFTTIRQRGAHVADIAIIVIAADDSLMPQTREAVAHAQAAGIPMLVAINKVDLAQADPERVRSDLTGIGLIPETYGGDIVTVEVSAHTGQGVEELLEYISLTAELEDLRADADGEFRGVVLESRVDKQAGVLANLIVQHGTVRVGDFVVVGELYGKVRAMTDSAGARVKSAGPSTPVQLLGFSETPAVGETAVRADNEHTARQLVADRQAGRRDEKEAQRKPKFTLDDVFGALAEQITVNIVLRADTQGSLEAISGILMRKNEESEANINIMLAGIGAPSEADVLLAGAAEATILSFNVNPAGSVSKAAAQKGIEIKTFRIIYELIDEVDRLMRGTREPVFEERHLGRAEVRMLIRHPRAGVVAGSYVTDGHLRRGAKVRVLRNRQIVHEGSITGLKRFKDDVREVQTGYECGINLDWDDVLEGDIIEAHELVEVEQA